MAVSKPSGAKTKGVERRGGNHNPKGSPYLSGEALGLAAGDNAKFLGVSMQLMALPDIDLHDPAAVAERLGLFFQIHSENDMKPTVAGMGLCLNGLDRKRLWEIRSGCFGNTRGLDKLPVSTTVLIKKAYKLMENLWENYMQNGKVNPVAGIFLGVNNYGYQDVKQVNVAQTALDSGENEFSAEDIRKRYLAEPGTKAIESDTTT